MICLTNTQLNSSSIIVYVVEPDMCSFLCIDGVGVIVAVGVGVGDVSDITTTASTFKQGFIVGVILGVGVGVSQVTVTSGS